jgi:hypothetical protein
MQVRFGSRKKIQFTDKTHPAGGILSVVIAVLSLAGLLALCLVSSSEKGNSGILAGVFGLLLLLAGITGFVMAAKCYKKDDIYMATPALGTVLNGVLILFCLLLYIMGTV